MGTYLGIDPGVSGGLVRGDGNHILSVHPMPITERDIFKLVKALSRDSPQACIEVIPEAIFGIGKSSMSKLYGNYRSVRMALVACNVPFTEVGAKQWQKTIGINRKKSEAPLKWKDRLRSKAQNSFPTFGWDNYNITTQRTFSDAMLIHYYCFLLRNQ